MLQDYYLLYPFMTGYPVLIPVHDPLAYSRINSLFDSLARRLIEKQSYWPCESRAMLSEILFFCRRIFEQSRPENPESIAGEDPLIDKALLILHGCYKEDLTLEKLALDLATNRTTLAARFKNATGDTVFGYLRSIRLRMAEHMVRETTLSMSTVMEHTGFKDASHFGKAFTDQYGKPPVEYRKSVGRHF
jgi:AraC family L-rhamnose operon regulatory protein RhaS